MSSPYEQAFEKAEESWAPIVGAFILEFGTIEDTVQLIISRNLADTCIEVGDLNSRLPNKLEILERIIKMSQSKETAQEEVLKSISAIKVLCGVRNMIAHNPLAIELEETKDGRMRFSRLLITGRKNPQKFESLDSLTHKLSELRKHRAVLFSLTVS
jgi:hypothetical protein